MHCREMYTGFWSGNMMERDHFEDPNIDVKKNKKTELQKIRWEGMDNINLVEDKANGMPVNAVMSFNVPKNAKTSVNI